MSAFTVATFDREMSRKIGSDWMADNAPEGTTHYVHARDNNEPRLVNDVANAVGDILSVHSVRGFDLDIPGAGGNYMYTIFFLKREDVK